MNLDYESVIIVILVTSYEIKPHVLCFFMTERVNEQKGHLMGSGHQQLWTRALSFSKQIV